MARARRAKPRRTRALVPLIVLALLSAGVVGAVRFWPSSLTAIGPTSSPVARTPATGSAPPASPTAPPASPTAPPASPAAPTPTVASTRSASAAPAAAEAVRAMESCRARVQAADVVLRQARTGIGHWSAHVAAERDAAADKISVEDRQRIFKETRLQGPKDQQRYAAALRAYDEVRPASCGRAAGAEGTVAATLSRCAERSQAQGAVLSAAAAAMGDWRQHLADMQRSRTQHNSDAQQVWIEAYEAAPPNIDAYRQAVRGFDPPRC